MIELGAVLVALAIPAIVAAAPRASPVAMRLESVAAARRDAAAPLRARWSALGPDGGRRALVAGAVALLATVSGLAVLAPALAYGAFIAPSVAADRRRAADRREAERSLGIAMEWTDALVGVGQPPERAFAAAARHGTGSRVLDPVLREACGAAALGAPLFRALGAGARDAGLDQLAALADELDRARDLGRGSRAVVRDARDELRRRERAGVIAAAAKVDLKLLLVLVACYLPALMLTVVVPLFVGLLAGILE
ncbi:MAG TPA: hypothetical protein VFW12_09790 [Candidatus Limnocylindria bacterium]|nr:hypothetical protein [Candidatus Limnocylindria bacterium]